jgi:hypothetical protein
MSDAATTTVATRPAESSRDASGAPGARRPAGGGPPPGDAPHHGTGRRATIIVMIVSLLASAFLRSAAVGVQERGSRTTLARRTAGAGASLAGMDSYAIALLLGGLRGPLVMVLWANSESQKNNRDLRGVDTQIEWIRLLQPEFDSVHLFQIWNKAYNLSVQTVSLANKYSTILDAVDYGRSVDAERPDNLHIVKELGRVYSDKLGQAYPERLYYRARVRKETMNRPDAPAGAKKGEPGFQRVAHDSMLDAAGNLLPDLTRPRFQRPADLPADAPFYDGSEFQYLKRFEPFPFGVSPIAIGYNYHKRAQVLADSTGQVHATLDSSVIDSAPALGLKKWAEEEWEHGRRLEFKATGLELPVETIDLEVPTAALALDAKLADPAVVPELLNAYGMVGRLADESRLEYERHLSNPEYTASRAKYESHLETLAAMKSLLGGDEAYLRAVTAAPGAERDRLIQVAARNYRNAVRGYGLILLRYYTDNAVLSSVLPAGVNRTSLGTGAPGSITAVTEEDVMQLVYATQEEIGRRGMRDVHYEDRAEYDAYVQRALRRLQEIGNPSQPAN